MQRIEKVLEDANLKITSVRAHHRFMLRLRLDHIDALDKAIADIEKEVGLGLEPFRQAARLPIVGNTTFQQTAGR